MKPKELQAAFDSYRRWFVETVCYNLTGEQVFDIWQSTGIAPDMNYAELMHMAEYAKRGSNNEEKNIVVLRPNVLHVITNDQHSPIIASADTA